MMKKDRVIVPYWILLLLVASSVCIVGLSAEAQQNKFRLKPGAQGKICLSCHGEFGKKLKQPFVHTPVKAGECSSCHNPHASAYGKMLAAATNKICFTCHTNIVPDQALSTHKPVGEGNCIKCHDPHSAKNKFNLLSAGNELCFGCHAGLADTIKKVKFKHGPVEKSCLNCHSPHASGKSVGLLQEKVPALCLKCHKTETPIFQKQHMNYPVAKALCTSCHDPHGSDKAGMLYANVHQPVAGKMCNQCHEEPGSSKPFATKKSGLDLCKGCHITLVNDALNKNRIHWPVTDKTGCLNCHSPHASKEASLLKTSLTDLCGECHADTIERQKQADTKHPPVQEGLCMSCHAPHASNNLFLIEQASQIELCQTCHDYEKHQTHPLGEKTVDPRNKNVRVTCASCHAAHGTANKHLLYYPTSTELCVQCHMEYDRR